MPIYGGTEEEHTVLLCGRLAASARNISSCFINVMLHFDTLYQCGPVKHSIEWRKQEEGATCVSFWLYIQNSTGYCWILEHTGRRMNIRLLSVAAREGSAEWGRWVWACFLPICKVLFVLKTGNNYGKI